MRPKQACPHAGGRTGRAEKAGGGVLASAPETPERRAHHDDATRTPRRPWSGRRWELEQWAGPEFAPALRVRTPAASRPPGSVRSAQFSCSGRPTLRRLEPQHARAPCPSPTPRVHPNPCPWSRRCHPTISSSVVPSPPALNLSRHQGFSDEPGLADQAPGIVLKLCKRLLT